MADSDNPKLIIDDDWKRQAQEEKKKLAEDEKKAKEAPGGAGMEPGQLPPPSFEFLITTFATEAFLAMGVMEHPKLGRMQNLELAKFNIDLLAVLEEKTKGNLTPQEKNLLDQTLHQLRITFVEVASMKGGPIGMK